MMYGKLKKTAPSLTLCAAPSPPSLGSPPSIFMFACSTPSCWRSALSCWTVLSARRPNTD